MATIFIFDLIITIDKNLYVIYNIFHNQGVFIMENEKENNKVNIKPFIILFLISIVIFAIMYFLHSKNIENRFNRTLQNYEKSMSAIFNNMIITNGNNENIYTNSFQTNNEIRFNNNIENLKLSFEVGFKMLESSMNEIMKNSNDILQFWFAFLSVIMIVFTIIGFFLNNNILENAKKQLEMVEKEARTSRENIEKETNKLIEENNKNIQEYNLFNLSTQAYYNKDYKLAIYYATEAIKLNNKNSALYNNIGFAKYNLANSEIENKNKYNKLIKEMIKYYDKAIKLNPNYSMAYNNRGISKAKLNMYEEAIKDFNKAIKINPNYSEAYNNKGIYNAKLNMYKEAIKNYNKAIKLNQNLSEAYNNRGISKAKLNMYEEAIKDYNKAIELNKDNPFYYYNRGNSKYNLSNLVKKEENKINEYSQLVKEAYEDFEIAYSLSNSKLKKYLINKIIVLAKENNETAIKFCEEHNIDYKNYKE